MPNDIVREKTQDDLDREKKTQQAQAIFQLKVDKQNQLYNSLAEYANLDPPKYPIKIRVKENKFEPDFIKDNMGSLLYASSFEDAISIVTTNLSSPDSTIQQSYNNSGLNPNNKKLRLSSQNKGMFRSFVDNLNKPKSHELSLIRKFIDYWVIILTDAPPSTLSNFRISNQKNYNKGGKSKKKSKKTNKKSKKTLKKSKKNRRRRRSYMI